jgi:hypothetical protein
LGIDNERQDCKIGTGCLGGICGRGSKNERDQCEGLWLIDFIHLNEIGEINLFNYFKWGRYRAKGDIWRE